MKKERKLKISSFLLLASFPLLLSSCSAESDDDQALLKAAEKAAAERDVAGGNVMLTLSTVYGDEWEEYASMCPEAPRDLVAQALNLKENDLPELQQEENALLRIKDSEVKAEIHRTEDFLLCGGSMAPAYKIKDQTVAIKDQRDLPAHIPRWWLTTNAEPLASWQ